MKNIQRQLGRDKKKKKKCNNNTHTHTMQLPPRCYTGKAAPSCKLWKSGLCECPLGNRLGKMSSSNNIKRISKHHIGMKLLFTVSVVGPLFISPLLFHCSRVLVGAWHFGLFCCVYSSFHYRLDLIREPAFYWVFIFIFSV